MAAARGLLPLASDDMLQALVALVSDPDTAVSEAASASIDQLDPNAYIGFAGDPAASPALLDFFCVWNRAPRELLEAVVFNQATPDSALAKLVLRTTESALVEAVSLKQQSLIRSPELIEAILYSPVRTSEAERRAREVRQEFFEKQFGARMVAEEQRVQSEVEAARETVSIEGLGDLVALGLIDEEIADGVDEIVTHYEAEFGPFSESPPPFEEIVDVEEVMNRLESEDQVRLSSDRIPIFQQIAMMSIKDRVMLAIKGTREARTFLVRDPNRIVAAAVLRNPRLTETEIEGMAAIRTVPEDVLRQIGQNRAWTKSYVVIHNLVRNPRTPIALSLGFLNRILSRDLRALSKNKNIPDVVRTTAARLYIKRGGM